MLDEVAGRRTGRAAGGNVLDATGVVPGAALGRGGIEDVDELGSALREERFEAGLVMFAAARCSASTGTIRYGSPVLTTCMGRSGCAAVLGSPRAAR